MNKVEFITKLGEEQIAWERFLGGFTAEQQLQPNVIGKWSVKDVVAHVAIWERYATAMVRAHVRSATGEKPPAPFEAWGLNVPPRELDNDPQNEWLVAQTSSWSFGETLGTQREVRAQMMAAVQTLSEDDLTNPQTVVLGFSWKGDRPLWRVIAEMGYEHAHGHMDNIRLGFEALADAAE
jgi:hypothetical protein